MLNANCGLVLSRTDFSTTLCHFLSPNIEKVYNYGLKK